MKGTNIQLLLDITGWQKIWDPLKTQWQPILGKWDSPFAYVLKNLARVFKLIGHIFIFLVHVLFFYYFLPPLDDKDLSFPDEWGKLFVFLLQL